VAHYDGSIPVVHGTIAAVVRRRVDRRMSTWRRPIVARRLYIPQALAPQAWAIAARAGWMPRDTRSDDDDPSEQLHPFELLTRAVHAVQEDRERLERELAESWCAHEHTPLFLDGALSRGDIVGRSPHVVGVVKSHRSLYAAGDAMAVVLALPRGSRSSVVRVTSARRQAVASWYLRLHGGTTGDPMFGLVRVEVAELAGESRESLTERADRVSRWILAEVTPLSLPDGRWDKMVYGVRDAEQTLRAML
jgi:hypothetical protein